MATSSQSSRRPITANPSQIIVEQLAASGVKYVFNNPGSREARFMDALHSHPDVHGILALHEGSVAAMAGGYTQAKLEPAAMVVHLSAGLAQSLGQVINLYEGSLPVVIITFAGDTGSYYDKIGMELDPSFGPTSISAPFTKSSWTIVEPEGLAHAVDRAFRVAATPPVGPVHLAIYDRMLGAEEVETTIIEGARHGVRPGAPDDGDLEELERALRDAKRLLLYVGDGVWKSGAQDHVAALAERYGAAVCGDFRSLPIKHPLHCGPVYEALADGDYDTIVCIGARHIGTGFPEPYTPARLAPRIVAIGSDVRNLKNIQDVDFAILADERKTLERLTGASTASAFAERRAWARGRASALREKRLSTARDVDAQQGTVRPWVLLDALDETLEDKGGASVMMEQFALPIASMAGKGGPGQSTYMYVAGGSEGYGVGGRHRPEAGRPGAPRRGPHRRRLPLLRRLRPLDGGPPRHPSALRCAQQPLIRHRRRLVRRRGRQHDPHRRVCRSRARRHGPVQDRRGLRRRVDDRNRRRRHPGRHRRGPPRRR